MRSRERAADELLVLAAQARQIEAFEHLATRWRPRMLRHALRLTGDPEGAQEAVQEAWVGIARGLGRLRDPAGFGPWVLRITTRRCADWIARRRRIRQPSEELNAAPTTVSPANVGDNLARVRTAIRGLDPERQALMAMYYLDGLSVVEIAQVLDIPAGTVKSRLHNAREQLRASLEV